MFVRKYPCVKFKIMCGEELTNIYVSLSKIYFSILLKISMICSCIPAATRRTVFLEKTKTTFINYIMKPVRERNVINLLAERLH